MGVSYENRIDHRRVPWNWPGRGPGISPSGLGCGHQLPEPGGQGPGAGGGTDGSGLSCRHVPGRCRGQRCRGRDGPEAGRDFQPGRISGKQRRCVGSGPVSGHHRRDVGPVSGGKSERRPEHRQGGPPPHDLGKTGLHRKYFLHLGPAGGKLRGGLLLHKGRHHRPDPVVGYGIGPLRHPGKLRGPRRHQH